MSEHVRLGGSKAHRWLVCHASPRLEEEAGPQPSSPYAAEGKVAHVLLERTLREAYLVDRLPSAADFIGEVIEGHEVTDEMAEAVQVAVDWVRETAAPGGGREQGIVLLERRVDLSKLGPPEPMSGTADVIILFPREGWMVTFDYKHGRGHAVDVIGNKQTRYYALGALLSLPFEMTRNITRVQMVIGQPRAWHPDGPVRSETVDLLDLLDFAQDLLDAAHAVQKPDAPALPGEHCLFCAAAPTCRAKGEQAVVVAQQEFSAVPDISTMTADEISVLVTAIEPKVAIVEAWLGAAKKYLHSRLAAGDTVPGWKLVEKRATRVWSDPAKVEAWAILEGIRVPSLYTEPTLKSPAQIEKLVGKKRFPADLTTSVSSGFTLAPASSTKPAAAVSAADEFTTVTP